MYKNVVAKPEGERQLSTPSRRQDNIKANVKDIKCEVVDFIYLTQVRFQWRAVLNTVMNLRVP
jgi:hypothetical protein